MLLEEVPNRWVPDLLVFKIYDMTIICATNLFGDEKWTEDNFVPPPAATMGKLVDSSERMTLAIYRSFSTKSLQAKSAYYDLISELDRLFSNCW